MATPSDPKTSGNRSLPPQTSSGGDSPRFPGSRNSSRGGGKSKSVRKDVVNEIDSVLSQNESDASSDFSTNESLSDGYGQKSHSTPARRGKCPSRGGYSSTKSVSPGSGSGSGSGIISSSEQAGRVSRNIAKIAIARKGMIRFIFILFFWWHATHFLSSEIMHH